MSTKVSRHGVWLDEPDQSLRHPDILIQMVTDALYHGIEPEDIDVYSENPVNYLPNIYFRGIYVLETNINGDVTDKDQVGVWMNNGFWMPCRRLTDRYRIKELLFRLSEVDSLDDIPLSEYEIGKDK